MEKWQIIKRRLRVYVFRFKFKRALAKTKQIQLWWRKVFRISILRKRIFIKKILNDTIRKAIYDRKRYKNEQFMFLLKQYLKKRTFYYQNKKLMGKLKEWMRREIMES